MGEVRIETGRLVLRSWLERDRDAFYALGNDPDTMRYLGPLRSRAEDDAAFERQRSAFEDHGTCGRAVERVSDGMLIGICGIKPAKAGMPIEGSMEFGWRFERQHQGQGYAFEAARAALAHAWTLPGTDHVVAITVHTNISSWQLMEKLGMWRVSDGDFDHPSVADDSPLKRHILYRIDRPNHV